MAPISQYPAYVGVADNITGHVCPEQKAQTDVPSLSSSLAYPLTLMCHHCDMCLQQLLCSRPDTLLTMSIESKYSKDAISKDDIILILTCLRCMFLLRACRFYPVSQTQSNKYFHSISK